MLVGADVQVNLQSLVDVVKQLKQTTDSKGHMNPVYRQIVFRDGSCWSFNGECGQMIKSPAPELHCMIPADDFLKVLSKYKGESIELIASDSQIDIVSGRSKNKLMASDPNLFPQIFPTQYLPFCHAQELPSVVKKTLSALDTDHPLSRVGICKQSVYATDGKRCTRIALSEPVKDHIITISIAAAHVLSAYETMTSAFASDSQLLINFDGKLFVATLSTGQVPFNQIDTMCDASVDPSNLKALPAGFAVALDRVSVLGEGQVRMESTGSDLILRSEVQGRGASEEAFDWEFKPFQVGIQPKHVLDAVRLTTMVDWTNCLRSSPTTMRFVSPGLDHFVALMVD